MPAIVFPQGATHARQTKDGMEEVFPSGGIRWMNENLPVEYGIYSNFTFIPMTPEQLAEVAKKQTPAFPVAKPASESAINKTKFIRDLLVNRGAELTAREIAQMVVDKFGGEFEKALSFTRAVPYHLKQKGIVVKYKRESEADAAPAAQIPHAMREALRNGMDEIVSARTIAPRPSPRPSAASLIDSIMAQADDASHESLTDSVS
jgi:hypothetical protein